MSEPLKAFRLTYKSKESTQRVTLMATDKEQAKLLGDEAQARRHARFPLTFGRLEQALDTGEPGLLAMDPRFKADEQLTESWLKAEIERRKVDAGRYDDGEWKLVKIEEAIVG